MPRSTSRPPRALVDVVIERYRDRDDVRRALGLGDGGIDGTIDARERSIEWLERVIERTFDDRFDDDERRVAETAMGVRDGRGVGTFAASAVRSAERELGTRTLVSRRMWDVLCNAEAARRGKTSECAELFCAFARGSYDDEALLFFLFCRRWLTRECQAMRARGERVTRGDRRYDAGAKLCASNFSLDCKQCCAVIRAIFFGSDGESAASTSDVSFLYATVKAMIEDAFETDVASSWATGRNENVTPDTGALTPKDATSARDPPTRMDAYRLLKMLLSVFVDTTPPEDAISSLKVRAKTKKSKASASVDVPPEPSTSASIPTATPKQTTSQTPSGDADRKVAADIARYELVVRTALTEAVGKYVAALFPKQVDRSAVDEAETKLNVMAQDLLSRVIDNAADPSSSAEIVSEAPAACASYVRARDSIIAGAGTPGAESPAAAGASSARDVARAILASDKVKNAIEPMLRASVSSLKTNS